LFGEDRVDWQLAVSGGARTAPFDIIWNRLLRDGAYLSDKGIHASHFAEHQMKINELNNIMLEANLVIRTVSFTHYKLVQLNTQCYSLRAAHCNEILQMQSYDQTIIWSLRTMH